MMVAEAEEPDCVIAWSYRPDYHRKSCSMMIYESKSQALRLPQTLRGVGVPLKTTIYTYLRILEQEQQSRGPITIVDQAQ